MGTLKNVDFPLVLEKAEIVSSARNIDPATKTFCSSDVEKLHPFDHPTRASRSKHVQLRHELTQVIHKIFGHLDHQFNNVRVDVNLSRFSIENFHKPNSDREPKFQGTFDSTS